MAANRKKWLRGIGRFVSPYRTAKGEKFRLKDIDPGDTGGFGSERKRRAGDSSPRAWSGWPERMGCPRSSL
jgi:hypothetical protein